MRIATWTFTALIAVGLSGCADTPLLGPGPDMDAERADIALGGIGSGSMPSARPIGLSQPIATGSGSGDMLDTEATLGDDAGLDDDDALGDSATDLGPDRFDSGEDSLLDTERGLAGDGLLD